MLNEHKRLTASAAMLLALGAVGAAMAAGRADPVGKPVAEPVRCELRVTYDHGGITLEGTVEADIPVSGSYQFRVVSKGGSGSSNIRQGGMFAAGPDEVAKLGRVVLSGGRYDASLEVTSNGATIDCVERAGGRI